MEKNRDWHDKSAYTKPERRVRTFRRRSGDFSFADVLLYAIAFAAPFAFALWLL